MLCFLYLTNLILLALKNVFRNYKTKIIYKSKNFIIIDKAYDFKINSNNPQEITVQTFLKQVYPSLVNKKLCHEFYFVHRLDYATSGLMCIPMHKEACKIVSHAFYRRETKKYYVALVRGLLSCDIMDLNVPIGEDIRAQTIQKMCTDNLEYCVNSRDARTIILLLEEGLYDQYPATKILIKPITGRRHQIRVHCSSLGHTIVGDYTYSNMKDTKPNRMFLHALRLILPNSLESIDVQTEDPFTSIQNWKTLKILNEVNEKSFEKLDDFCKI